MTASLAHPIDAVISPLIHPSRPVPAFGGNAASQHALVQLGRLLAAAGYRHHAVSPASHQRVVQRLRSRAPSTSTAAPATLNDIFGLSRPFSAEHVPAPIWNAMNEAGIVRRDGPLWRSSLRVASCGDHGPLLGSLLFHSAWPTIDDDAVFFGPDAYRMLAALDLAMDGAAVRRAIDIHCGTGAGAMAIARHWPQAEVLAADDNPGAVALAAVNAELAGLARVRALPTAAAATPLAAVQGDFDLILAQPPYLLDPCARRQRHGGGALGEARSLAIVSEAIARLAPGGRLLLYTGVAMVGGGDPVLARLAPLLDGAGLDWHYRELDGDIHGEELAEAGYEQVERIAAVWLQAQRRQP